MTDKIKSSFDNIRAEDELKRGTSVFLQKELARRKKLSRKIRPVRYAAALACVIVIFISGMLTYRLYFTPFAYVDIDVNPSIELTLNRFGRIIGAYDYNGGGGDAIRTHMLEHRGYKKALKILLDEMTKLGYITEGGLVCVTLQTDNKSRESVLLAGIQSGIEGYIEGHHQTAQVDVFPVSRDTRNESHELGLSPAKYLAIRELMAVDPTASVENCKGHTISEIKEQTRNHGRHHGGNSGGGDVDGGDVGGGNVGGGAVPEEHEESTGNGKNQGKSGGGNHHGSGH